LHIELSRVRDGNERRESPAVATDWSREEVEATVADYFAMLEAELAPNAYIASVA